MRFISAASGVESTRNHRKTIVGRKLTAACRDAGNSSAIRPVIGATISQKPIMKKPISTGPSTRLSTLPTRMSGEISGIQFFKVTFFSIKTDPRTPIISQFFLFAAPAPHPDGQKTCEICSPAGGMRRCRPPPRSRRFTSLPALARDRRPRPVSHAKNGPQDRPIGRRSSKMRRTLVFSRRFSYICRNAK